METNVEFEAAQGKKPSLFGMITSPTEQFKRMRDTAPIGWPLVFMLVLSAIIGALTTYIALSSPIFKNLNNTAGFKIPAAVTIGSGALGVLFTVAVTFFITAAVYKVLMIFMGNDTTYKKLLAIVIYTSIISSLGSLINAILSLALGNYDITSTYTSLSPLMGNNLTLKALASKFDLFQIWYLILTAMGLHFTAGLSKNKAITVVVIFFILGLGLTLVMNLFQQPVSTGL